MKSQRLPLIALFVCALALVQPAGAAEKPKIRAITAFLSIDRTHYEKQLHETAERLREAKKAFEQVGYEVQGIRIATQPFPEYTRGLSKAEAVALLKNVESIAAKENFLPSVGPALWSSGDDPANVDILAEALRDTKLLHGSIIVADREGLRWKAVREAARLIRYLADNSPGGYGNFNFAATAMLGGGAPFFPGAWAHPGMSPSAGFAIGWEAANVVAEALAGGVADPEAARIRLEASLGAHAAAIRAVAEQLSRRFPLPNQQLWPYYGLDVSPAPLQDISIGRALENFTGGPVGTSGTLTAATMITQVLQNIPNRTGYSGLMIPVMEDTVLARGWAEGKITLDSLLAYSAVCGTGLDTIPLPGSVTEEQLARIIGDMASLAHRWNKPLSARLMPIKGKKAGDRTTFNDPFLVNTTIQPLP